MKSKKPYVKPVLEKREKLSDVTQNGPIGTAGGQP